MRATLLPLGLLLLVASMSAGCNGHPAGSSYEAKAASTESDNAFALDQNAATRSKIADEFPFPADRGGQLLADKLRPANQIPPLPSAQPLESKRRSGPAKVENPDTSLPPAVVPAPPSIPLTKTKTVRRTLVEGEPPLSRQRLDLANPAPVKLAAGPKAAWPSPDINQPISLPILARPVVDRASLDDPSGEASQTAALAGKVPDRTAPAPFLRLTLPDPFEHRNAVRLQTPPPPDIALPAENPHAPVKISQ